MRFSHGYTKKSAAGFTAGHIQCNAVNVGSAVGSQERYRVGHFGKFSGPAERGGAGLCIAGAKLIHRNAAGIGQCRFVRNGTKTGSLQNTGSHADHADVLFTQFFGPGTGQGVDRGFAGSIWLALRLQTVGARFISIILAYRNAERNKNAAQ